MRRDYCTKIKKGKRIYTNNRFRICQQSRKVVSQQRRLFFFPHSFSISFRKHKVVNSFFMKTVHILT